MDELNQNINTSEPQVSYTEENIRHLSDMEHVRTRPGMYIGRLGDGSQAEDGIYVLLKEVVDNSRLWPWYSFGKSCGCSVHVEYRR